MGDIENRPPHPSQLRISDADRQKVADLLNTAAGEGRIDLDELDQRLEQTWAAKTYGDLVPITIDLQPVPVSMPQPSQLGHLGQLPTYRSSSAVMGECKRVGVWSVPEHTSALALMGSVTLDLREAQFTSRETVISANAIMGEVSVVVPAHVHLVVDGTPIMGEFTEGRHKVAADAGPGSPVVRVRGVALMGSVSVKRLPQPGTPKKFLGTY